jgi:plastocyanin
MLRKLTFLSTALAACALVACGGGGMTQNAAGGNAMQMNAGGNNPMPATAVRELPLGDDLAIMANLPGNTVGEELPEEGVGTSDHKPWGKVGGFTQTHLAQTLAFPPGTTITVRNLSKTNEHTFNFVKVADGAPAHFPANVNLSIPAHGNGVFGPGFASGPIAPGGSVKVKLVTPGTYLIGCAFHYAEGMQDVIVIKHGAKPGPQAQPTPAPTTAPQPTPTPPPSGGGW